MVFRSALDNTTKQNKERVESRERQTGRQQNVILALGQSSLFAIHLSKSDSLFILKARYSYSSYRGVQIARKMSGLPGFFRRLGGNPDPQNDSPPPSSSASLC